jgi:ssDNA-binding Zn-finger/Zn-ribbon topoisomerase 1
MEGKQVKTKSRILENVDKENKKPSVQNINESKNLSFEAPDTDSEIKTERKEAYIERPTQNLLRSLLKGVKNQEIIPVYDPVSGFIYKTIEPAFEKEISHEKAAEFLERLAHLDILKKSFFDTVSTCPYCESTTITLHYHCPKCNSHNLVKTNLTEHIPCGFITEREMYIDGKCPRCEDPLTEENYRNMGRWYICRECNDRFEHPRLEIICRRCNRRFTIEASKVLEIPKYSLNSVRMNEIRQNVASLEKISKVLQDLNFKVETPGVVIGQKSSMEHHFSIIARKDINDQETILALDHAIAETEVQSSPLILYIYKTSEVKVDLPIFVAIPKLSETAKKIAQGHQILLIEGSVESKESTDQLKKELELRLAQRISQPLPEVEISTSKQQDYRSHIKPRLFSSISSIHQPQESVKTKKTNRFMRTLKKTVKRVGDAV